MRKLRAAEAALGKGLLKDVPGEMLSKLNECIGKVDREASARLLHVFAEEDADLMSHWVESTKASQDAKIPEFTNQASINAIKPFMSEAVLKAATPYLALVGTTMEIIKVAQQARKNMKLMARVRRTGPCSTRTSRSSMRQLPCFV